jgi:hypothetical protein
MPYIYWVCRMSVGIAADQLCGVLCVGIVLLGFTDITGYYKKTIPHQLVRDSKDTVYFSILF